MKILAIETSCDETAIAVLEAKGGFKNPRFKILSNIVSSQIKLHEPFGGVVPNLAKREHQRNLIPVLIKGMRESKLLKNAKRKTQNAKPQLKSQNQKILNPIFYILKREPKLLSRTLQFLEKYRAPKIDLIAVTRGPGLEPALWVGLNFAKALAITWGKPLIGINHMEGHALSVLLKAKPKIKDQNPKLQIKNKKYSDLEKINFPTLALLVSGGHTELVLMKGWLKYKVIGKTRDDAAGEAFDKTARILGLGYPGGPAIAASAAKFLISNFKFLNKSQIPNKSKIKNLKSYTLNPGGCILSLPRPMLNSKNFDFSFSGLKTAVLYLVQNLKKNKQFNKKIIPAIAAEFQQAVIDVLISKTIKAAEKYKAKTIILGGGVAANKELRKQMTVAIKKELRLPATNYKLPAISFCGDNASMIAITAYFQAQKNPPKHKSFLRIRADGNLIL